jgi:hypothetical protein
VDDRCKFHLLQEVAGIVAGCAVGSKADVYVCLLEVWDSAESGCQPGVELVRKADLHEAFNPGHLLCIGCWAMGDVGSRGCEESSCH